MDHDLYLYDNSRLATYYVCSSYTILINIASRSNSSRRRYLTLCTIRHRKQSDTTYLALESWTYTCQIPSSQSKLSHCHSMTRMSPIACSLTCDTMSHPLLLIALSLLYMTSSEHTYIIPRHNAHPLNNPLSGRMTWTHVDSHGGSFAYVLVLSVSTFMPKFTQAHRFRTINL